MLRARNRPKPGPLHLPVKQRRGEKKEAAAAPKAEKKEAEKKK